MHVQDIDDEAAARVLVDRVAARHLWPFMKAECTIAAAAAKLDLSPARLQYWVTKLVRLRLLRRVRFERQGRHRIGVYRASAEAFTVALDKVPIASDDELVAMHARGFDDAERRALVQQARRFSSEWVCHYGLLNGVGHAELRPRATHSQTLPFVSAFGSVQLTPDVARALQRDLLAVIDRYRELGGQSGAPYLFKLLLVRAGD